MSQRSAEPPHTTRTRWADPLLAVVVAAGFQAEVWLAGDPSQHRPAVAVCALAMSLALAIRRRAPLVAVTVIGAAYVALLRLGATEYLTIVVIILIAAYSAGHNPDRLRAITGGLIILAANCYEVVLDAPRAAAEYGFIVLIVGAAWLAGFGMEQRERRASRLVDEAIALRRERDSAADQAASDEELVKSSVYES
jgi:hypothetical protein